MKGVRLEECDSSSGYHKVEYQLVNVDESVKEQDDT